MVGRRRPLPALVLMGCLALVAGFVWAKVLQQEATVTRRVSCPPATVDDAADTGEPVPYDALDRVGPAAPGTVSVRVLNTTDRTGLAGWIAEELEELGFQQAGPPDNDPHYSTGTMHCVGQIRFGITGRSAARTLSLLAPCTQLVRDTRTDSTVDLVLGAAFTTLAEDYRVYAVLRRLAEWARGHSESDGGLQSDDGQAPLSRSLLEDAHSHLC